MSARQAIVAAVVAAGLGIGVGTAGEKDAAPQAIRVGITPSLIQDNRHGSKVVVGALLEPLAALVRGQTGLATQVTPAEGLFHLGRELTNDRLQIGVFQGVEYAWVRQKYPQLRPLIVALNQKTHLHALLVVRADSRAAGFADLKGKALAVPRGSRLHTRLFLEDGCRKAGQARPEQFLAKCTTAANAEDALDDLCDGTLDALVVNEVAFESYARRKPARCGRLKVVQKSETFPPSVLAYRPGGIEPDRLKQFQDGLVNANQSSLSRHLMSFWRLTAFAPVPGDFEKLATAILKDYPPPREERKTGSAE